MSLSRHLFLILLILTGGRLMSQEKKTLAVVRASGSLEVDGRLDEQAWQHASTAKDFVQLRPFNGKPASQPTEVRILYDDSGLYIGALMLDEKPDSLRVELSRRDDLEMADHFGLTIDPYNDGLNAFGFFVSTRGVQMDMKTDKDGFEDSNWDAVWLSAVMIHDSGWNAEMMIPWSALRFSGNKQQVWGVNFFRSIQRLRENVSWNFIDSRIKGEITQSGIIYGMHDISPALRLSATPYLSAYADHNSSSDNWDTYANYGMDLKWGLSRSFTLDMTLIPDFGQVESDATIFSLSPFEVFYEEKRPFFTEGTELFSKGNVFYSRRVGARPSGYFSVPFNPGVAEVIDNPEQAQLINAVKLSGKTGNGLGIGVFNAMTANTYATVRDTSGDTRRILTEPFTNFNMVIADQSFRNNSYLSVYNTSVYRPEQGKAALVSGTDYRFRDKHNQYEISGIFNLSQHYDPNNMPDLGFRSYTKIGRVKGVFQYDAWFNVETDNYDPNDMGFLMNNNDFATGTNFRYNIFEPRGNILRMFNTLSTRLVYLYAPRKFSEFIISGTNWTTLTNHLTLGGFYNIRPLESNDYFEARTPGRVFVWPSSVWLNVWSSPDYRKKYLVDLTLGVWQTFGDDQTSINAEIEPRLRFSNSFMLRPEISFDYHVNSKGFVRDSIVPGQDKTIIFGRRNITNLTTSLKANYIFNKNTSVSFRLRHYWMLVDYLSFYNLNMAGRLDPADHQRFEDFSVNAFNIDMVFKWDFAPGSELLLIWKNAVFQNNQSEQLVVNYFDNLNKMFESPVHNSFSIKLLYYLDWQQFKRKGRRDETGLFRPERFRDIIRNTAADLRSELHSGSEHSLDPLSRKPSFH